MHGKRIGTLFGLMGAVWLAACGGTEALEEAAPSTQAQALAPVTLPIRINAGGGAFTDTYGRLWEADRNSSGGEAFRTTEPIAFTENDGLYQSMRVDVASYDIPVPGPGIYTVQLLFTEPVRNLSASRSMRILAEGEVYVHEYRDLVTPLFPYTLFFDVPVRDSTLSVYFMRYAGTLPPVVSAVEVTASRWKWMDGSPQPSGGSVSGAPALAVDGSNRPVVAWADRGTDNVQAAQWTGSAWQALGGALGDTRASSPVLLSDASGAPLVAFVQSLPLPTGVRVRARRWDGASWTEVGGLVGLQGYEATGVAAALDNQGRPLLAVALAGRDAGVDSRLHVYRLEGGTWVQVGDAVRSLGGAASDGDIRHLSLAVDRTDRIVVAWGEDYWRGDLAGKSFSHVFRRDSGLWKRVGTQVPDATASASRAPCLALAADGTPWVAYVKNGTVDVVREQNGAWVATPNAGLKGWPVPTPRVGAPLLRMDSAGAPTVLLRERSESYAHGRFLRKWNGTAWVPVINSRVGPFDTTPLLPDAEGGLEADTALAVNRTGQLLVAMPEAPPSGASYGPLRVRTFTP